VLAGVVHSHRSELAMTQLPGHMPGYNRQAKELTQAFAHGGLNGVMPNLYHREAPGADPGDAMAAARPRA
jgi:hypothetical protein